MLQKTCFPLGGVFIHPGAHGIDKAAVEQYVRKSGGEVITKKGQPFMPWQSRRYISANVFSAGWIPR